MPDATTAPMTGAAAPDVLAGADPATSRATHLRRRALLQAGAGLASAVGLGLAADVFAAEAAPLVRTTAGLVRGARGDAGCKVFKGIPYGASTAGAARFMPPRPPEPWTGIREATALGPRAPGLGYPPILMREEGADLDATPAAEDCLVLNVWTPATGARGARRPVMVWLHGGGYVSGSGGSVRYDGTRLATRQDVVVVTVNHRIGALGFLYLGGLGGERYAASGNAGLQDIVRALEWVRDDIATFGGDPGNVTLFGESGGGGKVSTLMAMPAARGLFHRAIAESGTALRVATPEAATKTAQGVLDKLGVTTANLEALYTLPFAQIAAATPPGIGPVVDGVALPRQPFDPDGPPISARVPLLLGSNLTEITFFNDTPLEPIDDGALGAAVAKYTAQPAPKADALVALYRQSRPGAANHEIYQAIATDWWMTANVHRQAERKAAQGAAPAYVYQFAMAQGARGGRLNAPHTAEIAYVFDNLALSNALVGDATPERQRLADQVSTAWANFARHGRPTASGLPSWPAWHGEARPVMVLDARPHLAAPALAREQAFIQSLRAT